MPVTIFLTRMFYAAIFNTAHFLHHPLQILSIYNVGSTKLTQEVETKVKARSPPAHQGIRVNYKAKKPNIFLYFIIHFYIIMLIQNQNFVARS